MGISSTANKHGFRVAGRVAGEENINHKQLVELKSICKTAEKMITTYYYLFAGSDSGASDEGDNVVRAIRSAGIKGERLGFDERSTDISIMRVAHLARSTPGIIRSMKLVGYTDKPRLVLVGEDDPIQTIRDDYKSNGPITRAVAAYYAKQLHRS